jgi:hypothetical protein
MVEIKNVEEGEVVRCPACDTELELNKYGKTWELWELEEDED